MEKKELGKEKKELEKELTVEGSDLFSDLKALESKLDVESLAVNQANENLPSTKEKIPDANEDRIRSVLTNYLYEYEQKINSSIDNLKTLLRNRCENSKNILESVAFAPESFNQEATVEKAKELNEYKRLKNDLKIKTSHLTTFQNKHDLDRPAHYPLTNIRTAGVILLILLLEILLNGVTFSAYVEKGLVGGIVLALVIAGGNIFFGFVVGKYFFVQTWHKNIKRRIYSYLACILWCLFVIYYNLFIAYTRDNLQQAMGGNFEVAEFFRDTFNLEHYQNYESWFLFLLGVIFAIIALIDGVASDDLYFGYGRVDRQEKEAKNAIQDLLDELTDDLENIKEKYIKKLKTDEAYVHSGKNESQSLYSSRDRKITHFDHLVDATKSHCKILIKTYREKNAKVREDAPPNYFEIDPEPLIYQKKEFDKINMKEFELNDKNIFNDATNKINDDYKRITNEIIEQTS